MSPLRESATNLETMEGKVSLISPILCGKFRGRGFAPVPNMPVPRLAILVLFATGLALVAEPRPLAEQVRVRYAEGSTTRSLVLHKLDGTLLADGDLTQTADGDQVTTHLVFHFRDGSVQDQTSVFTERGAFKLLTDHLIQKGPSFPRPLEQTIDMASGRVSVKYLDQHQNADSTQMSLPADLSNGMLLAITKNLQPGDPPASVGFLIAAPKPRLVKLVITAGGEEALAVGGVSRTVTHYVVKVRIGGVSGFLAPVVGKQPPDSHVWIAHGDVPEFVKAEEPFYFEAPLWRIELANPL
jgi:hypothetical protein